MSDIYKDLKRKTHEYIKEVYKITENFPKSELYGSVSQLRRSALSIMLNYLEGYGRFKPKVKLNFFEIAYASNRESRYIIFLAYELKWIEKSVYDMLYSLSDDIGAMIYKIKVGLEKQIDSED